MSDPTSTARVRKLDDTDFGDKSASSSSDSGSAAKRVRIAEPLTREQKLDRLRQLLRSMFDKCPESAWCVDANDNDLLDKDKVMRLRKLLRKRSGVVVLQNAVTKRELLPSVKRIGECMVDMFATAEWTDEEREKLRNGRLYAANRHRNVKNGFLLSSFAYLFKQFTKPGETPDASVGDSRPKFVHHPIHHRVLMHLMADKAHPRTALLLAMSANPQHTMLSWDSVKLAGGPGTKTMTKQTRTVEHIDVYSDDAHRVQALINSDANEYKLCFVPFTNTPRVRTMLADLFEDRYFYKHNGFKALPMDKHADVIAVLDEFAVAAPRHSMIMWASGVVHYEAITRAPANTELLPRFEMRATRGHNRDRRLRFVVGTHTPVDLSTGELRRLAVIAARGAIPDYNQHVNKSYAKAVHKNIMCLKRTQYLRARTIEHDERQRMRRILSPQNVKEDFAALPPLYKHLYGVSQPLNTLGFSDQVVATLEHVANNSQ